MGPRAWWFLGWRRWRWVRWLRFAGEPVGQGGQSLCENDQPDGAVWAESWDWHPRGKSLQAARFGAAESPAGRMTGAGAPVDLGENSLGR